MGADKINTGLETHTGVKEQECGGSAYEKIKKGITTGVCTAVLALSMQVSAGEKGKKNTDVKIPDNLIAAVDNDKSQGLETKEKYSDRLVNFENELQRTGVTPLIQKSYVLAVNILEKGLGKKFNNDKLKEINKIFQNTTAKKILEQALRVTKFVGNRENDKKIRQEVQFFIQDEIIRFLLDYADNHELNDLYDKIDEGNYDNEIAEMLNNKMPKTIIVATAEELDVSHLDYNVSVEDLDESLKDFIKSDDVNSIAPKLRKYFKKFQQLKTLQNNTNALRQDTNALRQDTNALRKDTKLEQEIMKTIDNINRLIRASQKV